MPGNPARTTVRETAISYTDKHTKIYKITYVYEYLFQSSIFTKNIYNCAYSLCVVKKRVEDT